MLDRYSKADRVCAGGAALVAIATYLPWFHSTTGGFAVTVNGFRSGVAGDIVFLTAAAMVLLLMIRHGIVRTGLAADLPEGELFLGTGGVAVLATIVQIMVGNGGGHMPAKGLLLGCLGIAAMAVGGWMQYRDDAGPSHAIGKHTSPRMLR